MRSGTDGRTLNTTIYERLREEILTGKLMPGERLKVSSLALVHEVSLNVVREALNRLAGEQFVDIAPQFGFTVRGLSAEDLVDLYRQRAIFEGIALRQAIARGDLEWQSKVVGAHHRLSRTPKAVPDDPDNLNPEWLARHEAFNISMMEACGSPRLLQIVRQLAEGAAMYQRALLPKDNLEGEAELEHLDLVNAIIDGHTDDAVRILTQHLEQTRDRMLPFLQEKNEAKSPPISASVLGRSVDPDADAKPRRGRPPGSKRSKVAL